MSSDNGKTMITYQDAGVDIQAADSLVKRLKTISSTQKTGVVGGIGGFGALFALNDALSSPLKDPVLVSGTDGVGTKLKVAFATGRHETVGIDLVAMCVNDVITSGAKPLFFLDYFATGKLDSRIAETVIRGISYGCDLAECALIGGETAELPGMLSEGEYDIAGFVVGIVEREKILDGSTIEPNDTIIGIHSRGIHSNGLSLAQKVLLEAEGKTLGDKLPSGQTIADALLQPTAIYHKTVQALLCKDCGLKALAHITGGGIPGNLPRVLPENIAAELAPSAWPTPEIFQVIQSTNRVSEEEMFRSFNMGIGMFAVVKNPEEAILAIESAGEAASVVGRTIPRQAPESQVQWV